MRSRRYTATVSVLIKSPEGKILGSTEETVILVMSRQAVKEAGGAEQSDVFVVENLSSISTIAAAGIEDFLP